MLADFSKGTENASVKNSFRMRCRFASRRSTAELFARERCSHRKFSSLYPRASSPRRLIRESRHRVRCINSGTLSRRTRARIHVFACLPRAKTERYSPRILSFLLARTASVHTRARARAHLFTPSFPPNNVRIRVRAGALAVATIDAKSSAPRISRDSVLYFYLSRRIARERARDKKEESSSIRSESIDTRPVLIPTPRIFSHVSVLRRAHDEAFQKRVFG